MGVILAIVVMRLFSFAAADPPSPQDYVLCSQAFIMNQYCTSKLIPTSAALDNHPRPRGGPGVVNKTEINEEISRRFADFEDGIERNFTRWSREADSEMERMKAEIATNKNECQELKGQLDEMKASLDSEMKEMSSLIANGTKDLKEKIESKFTSWRMEAESDMRAVKAWIEKRNVSCSITFNGICYWSHVEDKRNVNIERAERICSNKSSTLAHFPTEEVYNAVVEDVRSKNPSSWSDLYVWTGVIITRMTNGRPIYPNGYTYTKWYPGRPSLERALESYTHVALEVDSPPDSRYQGMFNVPPQRSYHGVVCQMFE